ncbi:phage antirepressor Ant [Escherichia coli]|nr:phage antirepressor Ant [Escherichia coli]
MTSQLIPVFNGTIDNAIALLCNARDLHAFLGVKKVFAAWITNRISEYEFIENQDYILLSNLGKQTSGRGGHNRKDYHLTLDTAKELAIPFPPGPLTTVKFGALPLHTIQCCTIAHHQLR